MAVTGRAITVDGVRYWWKVRPKPTYSEGLGHGPLRFAVEHADGGATLLVSLPVLRPDNWIAPTPFAVRPRLVADTIRAALARGWDPRASGPVFEMTLPDDAISAG